MNKSKAFLFLVFLLPLFAAKALACQCAGPGSPCQDYWKASAVFIGTVSFSSSMTRKLGEYQVGGRLIRFTVDRAFQGVKGKEVEVTTGLGDADCGYGFRLGGQYLVYAYRDEENKLVTGSCSRTRPVSEASDDLAYIAGLAKAERGATIFGEVKRLDRAATFAERLQPVSDVKIVIEGPSKRVEAVTDNRGNFRVSHLPPDTYKVKVELPDGLSIHNPERETKVSDRGCAEVGFWVEVDTRISGKVLDAEGQPAADVLLELVPLKGQREAFSAYVRTDKEGRYEMKLLRPGRYLLGVRIYGSAGSTYVPFPRTYYAGVSEEARATILTLAEGQRLDLSELILPPRLVERTLNGIVADVDGRPVCGATVWLKEREYADADMPYRTETDSEGRFSFKVYEGINYHLFAYVDVAKDERKQAEVEMRVSSNPETVRLILRRRQP